MNRVAREHLPGSITVTIYSDDILIQSNTRKEMEEALATHTTIPEARLGNYRGKTKYMSRAKEEWNLCINEHRIESENI